MQGQIYVEVLAPKEQAPALPAGADPRRRPDRHQLDGHAGRPRRLGGIFRRARLRRLHDRPADARPFGLCIRATARRACSPQRTSNSSSPRSKATAPGRGRRSTRSGPATAPTKASKAIRSSTRSMPRKSRPCCPTRRPQQRNQDAGAALLDKIGPAIVLTHSQSGSFGWLIADARPKLVKAIIAIEPSGPPFEDTDHRHRQGPAVGTDRHPDHLRSAGKRSERVRSGARRRSPTARTCFVCWMQKAPARSSST